MLSSLDKLDNGLTLFSGVELLELSLRILILKNKVVDTDTDPAV